MAQLKSADILGEIANDGPEETIKVEEPTQPKQSEPSKTNDDLQERKAAAERAGAGKPSPYQSDLREKLRQKQQFNLGLCPTFVVKEYERLRKKAKMNKREFLYHLLREAGADIPPYKEMDGRKL